MRPFQVLRHILFLFICIPFLAIALACHRVPVKNRAEAMRLVSTVPPIEDDLSLGPLLDGIKEEIEHFKKLAAAGGAKPPFVFGPRVISQDDYLLGLEHFRKLGETIKDKSTLYTSLKDGFEFYEVYGRDHWGEVRLTSYYEPEILGSLNRSRRFSRALLSTPDDLVDVALGKYDDRFSNLGRMRGRLVDGRPKGGRLQLVPYYTREEIDSNGVLAGRGLELCWVDPVDAFSMQTQGSGTIVLENGTRLRLGNSDLNGHIYQPIGNYLTHLIPLEKMTLQNIEAYLQQLPPEKSQLILNKNPSYVFFQKLEGPPLTTLGTGVIAGRTIAVDSRYFPKGALGLLSFEKPRFDNAVTQDASGWDRAARLVLDQDTGGVIRGGGRVDLFWGTGAEAKRSAGLIRQTAHLLYLAPKASLLEQLHAKGER